MFTGYNGGLTVWQNDFVEEYFGIDPDVEVFVSGAITVFNGVISTIIGAYINDKRVAKKIAELEDNNIDVTDYIRSAILVERA